MVSCEIPALSERRLSKQPKDFLGFRSCQFVYGTDLNTFFAAPSDLFPPRPRKIRNPIIKTLERKQGNVHRVMEWKLKSLSHPRSVRENENVGAERLSLADQAFIKAIKKVIPPSEFEKSKPSQPERGSVFGYR
jgi:hypothetical protein